MPTATFTESIKKCTLTFKEDNLEKEFQDERHKLATIATIRYIKIMFGVVLSMLLLELAYFLLGKTVDGGEQTKIRLFVVPGYFITYLIELGLLKLKIRLTRGFLTIVANFCLLALSPTQGNGEFHPIVMPCIVTIILLSQHLCYNWIVASISIFVGMIIFLIYSYQMSNAYPFNTVIPNILFYFAFMMLNCYTIESDGRKSFFLRWQSQKKEEQWENVLNQLPEGIAISPVSTLDHLYMNNKGRQIHSSILNETIDNNESMLLTSGAYNKTDGSKIHLEVTQCPLIFQNINCLISVTKDVTAIKEQEHKKLQEKYQNMLLCMISHELRTPLNGIHINLEHLLPNLSNREICIENIEINQELCSAAIQSSKRLWYFVNGILLLAQIQANELTIILKEINIKKAAYKCLDLFRYEYNGRRLNITVDVQINDQEEEIVNIDEMKYQIILISLLMNAMKYTYQGFIHILIYFELDKYGEKSLVTIVEDSGIGIEPTRIPTLFKMFSKLEALDYDSHTFIHGIGFGLSVSYELVNKMNGTIKIESEVNTGTKVYFSLPLSIIENEEEIEVHVRGCRKRHSFLDCNLFTQESHSLPQIFTEREARQDIYVSRLNMVPNESLMSVGTASLIQEELKEEAVATLIVKKILIVDDNSVNILSLRLLLNKIHVQVDTALNGLEAIHQVNENGANYSLIFMDIDMPIMNGLEATEHLRKKMNMEEINWIPIVAVTAYASKQVQDDCYTAGVDQIYFKPISFNQIKTCLSEYQIPFHNDPEK